MLCSMSRKDNCWDNAPMESFFGSMKTELGDGTPFQSHFAAKNAVFSFIEGFYNRYRLHSAIGYCSPIDKEKLAAAAWAVTGVHFSGGRSQCLHDVALDIGMAVNHSTYDTLYLAFAIATGARAVVVADASFVANMQKHPDRSLATMLLPLDLWAKRACQ